jgi:predicted membrane channel-forming protein YqfA (hemolysin III family)
MADAPKKKVVHVENSAAVEQQNTTWKATPQAKSQALVLRIIAAVLWVLAIGGEAFSIFYLLKQNPVNFVLLIVLLVAIAILAIVGDVLWKRSNRLDPASRTEPVRFFVQNQLGAIIGIIAFVPLIILILLNKNMTGQQKGIAGAIGGVLLIVAVLFGISFNPPSVEQYDQETATVVQLTGADAVTWTKSGKVYHLCEKASAVNLTSKDNQIYTGTVADAHAAGKQRLTLEVDQELAECGFPPRTSASLEATAPAATPTP